jgi:hypothetical protein
MNPPSNIQNRLQSTIPNRNADVPIGINSAPATRHSAYGANPKSPNCPTLLFASRCPLETL